MEDNFNNEVYWTIKTTPLFISNCPVSSIVKVRLCKLDENPPDCTSTWKFNNNEDTISFTSERTQNLIYHPTGSEEDVTPKIESNSCSAILGITKDFVGISGNKLNALQNIFTAKQDSIKDLKERWKYPKNQEFAIKLKKETDENFQEYKTSNVEPSNIYSKEFKTWIIDENAVKTSIIINLQVW